MAQDFTLIAFADQAGAASLYTPDQCEAAVSSGRIQPDTQITVYRGSNGITMPARDFPLFAALFELNRSRSTPAFPPPPVDTRKPGPPADDPEEQPTELTAAPQWVGRSLGWNQTPAQPEAPDSRSSPGHAAEDGRATEVYREPTYPAGRDRGAGRGQRDWRSPPAPSYPSQSYPPASPAASSRPSSRSVPPASRQPEAPAGPRPDGSGGGSSGKWFLILLLPVLILIGGISYVVGDQLGWWKQGGGTSTDGNDSDAAAEPVEKTLYAMRQIDVQEEARPGSGIATLSRGTSLTGVVVPGTADADTKWLRIRYGPQTGRFVALTGLDETTRPILDTSFAGRHPTVAATTLRTAPSATASTVAGTAERPAGTTLEAAGKVGGSWAEILLDGGAVGYAPMSAFQGSATGPSTPVSSTPADAADRHQIVVTNSCASKALTIGVYYFDGQRWQSNDGATWTFAGGTSKYPSVGTDRLVTTTDVIYYAAIYGSGALSEFEGDQEFTYGSRRLKMRRANINRQANGDFEISFNC